MLRRFMHDLPLKLLSLIIAILLWSVVAGEKTSEIGMTVPVELQNLPNDLELASTTINTVEVRLRASPGIIQRLGPGEVAAHIDLAGFGEGEHIFHLTDRSLRHPFGVNVVKIRPSSLTLNLERTLQRDVPIKARTFGRLAA